MKISKTITLILVTWSMVWPQLVFGQWTCDTEDPASDILLAKGITTYQTTFTNVVLEIYTHVIHRTNGTGGLTQVQVDNAIEQLRDDYKNDNIYFNVVGQDAINSDTYYNFVSSSFNNLVTVNAHSDAIDIYLLEPGQSYGRAAGIPGIALVLGGNYAGTSVLSHEMGHVLGLYHTHSGRGCNDNANCAENQDGSNCDTCGDRVCDTPADPCLSSNVDSSCEYTGPAGFSPLTDNIMSYTTPSCMADLTDGQFARAHTVINESGVFDSIINRANLTLSNQTITSTETFVATNTITAGPAFIVESGADVTLSAGNSIRLLPGFHAKAGSHFRARVGYVPPTPQPPTAPGGLYIVNESSLGGNPVLQWSASTGDPTISYRVYRCDRTRDVPGGTFITTPCTPGDYFLAGTTTNTTFTDNIVIISEPDSALYWHDYYVVASNGNGTSGQSNHVDINGGGIIPEKAIPELAIPDVYSLSRGYPNPFNPTVIIPFGLPETSTAVLIIYDIMGREVTRLVDGTKSAGYHQVIWNGRTASGLSVASGIYIYRLVATSVASGEHFIATKKMIFLK